MLLQEQRMEMEMVKAAKSAKFEFQLLNPKIGSNYSCVAQLFVRWSPPLFLVYPRARFAKDVSLLTIWPKGTHSQGLGVD
jgi:hypothetical protein